jgi:hypothetical protein
VALATTGCTQKIEATQVEGTWVHAGPKGETAELLLSADGKASGRDIPRTTLFGTGPVDWTNTYGFQGTWTLRTKNRIELDMDQVVHDGLIETSGSSTFLYARVADNAVALSRPLGDPDNGNDFVFERK